MASLAPRVFAPRRHCPAALAGPAVARQNLACWYEAPHIQPLLWPRQQRCCQGAAATHGLPVYLADGTRAYRSLCIIIIIIIIIIKLPN
jgi:hypothetical protein